MLVAQLVHATLDHLPKKNQILTFFIRLRVVSALIWIVYTCRDLQTLYKLR